MLSDLQFGSAHSTPTLRLACFLPRQPEGNVKPSLVLPHLQFIQLKLQRHIFRTVCAVIIREAATFDLHLGTHVDGPGVVGVAREEARRADFDAVGPAGVLERGLRDWGLREVDGREGMAYQI